MNRFLMILKVLQQKIYNYMFLLNFGLIDIEDLLFLFCVYNEPVSVELKTRHVLGLFNINENILVLKHLPMFHK